MWYDWSSGNSGSTPCPFNLRRGTTKFVPENEPTRWGSTSVLDRSSSRPAAGSSGDASRSRPPAARATVRVPRRTRGACPPLWVAARTVPTPPRARAPRRECCRCYCCVRPTRWSRPRFAWRRRSKWTGRRDQRDRRPYYPRGGCCSSRRVDGRRHAQSGFGHGASFRDNVSQVQALHDSIVVDRILNASREPNGRSLCCCR